MDEVEFQALWQLYLGYCYDVGETPDPVHFSEWRTEVGYADED